MSKAEVPAENQVEAAARLAGDSFMRDLMTTNGNEIVARHSWGSDPALAYIGASDPQEVSSSRTYPVENLAGFTAISNY
jgi:hypothetical protein